MEGHCFLLKTVVHQGNKIIGYIPYGINCDCIEYTKPSGYMDHNEYFKKTTQFTHVCTASKDENHPL